MTFQLPIVAGLMLALFGSTGFFFTVLRYHRDEAGKIITQHSAILEDMRKMYDAVKEQLEERTREVRQLRRRVAHLEDENQRLTNALARCTHDD